MKSLEIRTESWNPAAEFYKSLKRKNKALTDKKDRWEESNLLLRNLLKTNLKLLKSLDLSNTVLF